MVPELSRWRLTKLSKITLRHYGDAGFVSTSCIIPRSRISCSQSFWQRRAQSHLLSGQAVHL